MFFAAGPCFGHVVTPRAWVILEHWPPIAVHIGLIKAGVPLVTEHVRPLPIPCQLGRKAAALLSKDISDDVARRSAGQAFADARPGRLNGGRTSKSLFQVLRRILNDESGGNTEVIANGTTESLLVPDDGCDGTAVVALTDDGTQFARLDQPACDQDIWVIEDDRAYLRE